jgi:AcrR family transcriptional regulator
MPVAIEGGSQVILQAAKEQLMQEGYRGFSIRKVARQCGLAVGTIYNYFPSKKDLVVTLMIDYWEDAFAALTRAFETEHDIYGRLRQVYLKLKRFIEIFQESWADAEVNGQIYPTKESTRQQEYLDRLYGLVERTLREYWGTEEKEIDAGELARFIVLGFLTMVYTHQLAYDEFERMVRRLIE